MSYTIISIYYYEEDNVLIDEDDNIIYDIFRLITPGQLMLFKEKRGTYYVNSKEKPDIIYELVFPLYDEEE